MVRSAACASRARRGRLLPWSQAHVFLNHSVGSTWIGAASGPRFAIVMRARMSSGAVFAYSTVTSKYRLSSKAPASSS